MPKKYKKENDTKKILAEYNKDVRRHMSTLSEDFQGKVSVIAEQYGSINKKLDEHGRILGEHGRILGEHGRKLDSHTEMIGKILIEVNEIKVGLKQKVDFSDFAKLEKRVTVIERRLATA